jgi:hypothetical protein
VIAGDEQALEVGVAAPPVLDEPIQFFGAAKTAVDQVAEKEQPLRVQPVCQKR